MRTWRGRLLPGSDYFFNPKMSAFIEYKYPRIIRAPKSIRDRVAFWDNS